MRGESLDSGAFGRWYLDVFIDAAMKVGGFLKTFGLVKRTKFTQLVFRILSLLP